MLRGRGEVGGERRQHLLVQVPVAQRSIGQPSPLPPLWHFPAHESRKSISPTLDEVDEKELRSMDNSLFSQGHCVQTELVMDESKMTATAADLERALVESLADAAMPSLAAADDQQQPAPTTAEDEEEDATTALAYQDGDLPEFSDGESERNAASSSAAGGGLPRHALVPAKSAKGPGGRRKVPIAALKARLTGAGSSAAAAAAKKASTAPPPPTAAAALTAAHAQDKGKGKGKSKELKLSDSQLDAVAQRIAQEHPELPKLSPDQVQELVASMQIDKDVLLGKKGLMGKGTKDMACV